jgi:hypothetical protein
MSEKLTQQKTFYFLDKQVQDKGYAYNVHSRMHAFIVTRHNLHEYVAENPKGNTCWQRTRKYRDENEQQWSEDLDEIVKIKLSKRADHRKTHNNESRIVGGAAVSD